MGIDTRKDTDVTTAEHTPELALPDGVWIVDPGRSKIGFDVKALWGLQTVRGVFAAYDGSLTVRASGAAGKLTIDAASLDTGHTKREVHLRSPDFFDVEKHPQIVFIATSVSERDGGLTVAGDLSVASRRLRLEIPVDVKSMPDGPPRLEGRTTVTREAAGMTWNRLGSIAGDAVLHAQLTLTRAAA